MKFSAAATLRSGPELQHLSNVPGWNLLSTFHEFGHHSTHRLPAVPTCNDCTTHFSLDLCHGQKMRIPTKNDARTYKSYSQTLNVWYIYLNVVNFYDKCASVAPRMPVTSRIVFTFYVQGSQINLPVPLLLGGGHTQPMFKINKSRLRLTWLAGKSPFSIGKISRSSFRRCNVPAMLETSRRVLTIES